MARGWGHNLMRSSLYIASQAARHVGRVYRPVTMTSTPLSNFQVRVVLTPSNFNYASAKSNGGDIRFYENQSFSSTLPMWVESWNYGGTSAIWVKVPSQGKSTMYMTYGKPSLNSISDIDTVMENGMQFFYFASTFASAGTGAFNSFQFAGLDPVMSTDWGSGTVSINGQGSLADYVSIRWRGWVKPYESGNHTFYLTTDDGSRMYIAPDSSYTSNPPSWTINSWIDQGPTEYSTTVSITDGVPRYVQKEWFETGGGATSLTGWATPSILKVYPITSGYLKAPKYDLSYSDSFGYSATVGSETSI